MAITVGVVLALLFFTVLNPITWAHKGRALGGHEDQMNLIKRNKKNCYDVIPDFNEFFPWPFTQHPTGDLHILLKERALPRVMT